MHQLTGLKLQVISLIRQVISLMRQVISLIHQVISLMRQVISLIHQVIGVMHQVIDDLVLIFGNRFFYKILKFCFINVHTGTGIYLKYEVYIKHILYSTIRNLVIGRSSHRDKKRRRKYVTACVQSKLHINKQNPIYFSGQTMYTLYSVSYYSIYVRCTSMFSMKGRQFRLTDLYTK